MEFIYARMKDVHGENADLDYMINFKQYIDVVKRRLATEQPGGVIWCYINLWKEHVKWLEEKIDHAQDVEKRYVDMIGQLEKALELKSADPSGNAAKESLATAELKLRVAVLEREKSKGDSDKEIERLKKWIARVPYAFKYEHEHDDDVKPVDGNQDKKEEPFDKTIKEHPDWAADKQ